MNRTTGSAEGHTPPAWANPYLLMGVALAGNLVVALGNHHFPYQDITNHLARYTLLDRYWFGVRPPFITARLVPGPYMGVDILGVMLVHFFGAAVTLKIFAVIAVVALPLGLWVLLDAVGRRYGHEDVRLWALAAVPLSLGWFTGTSFINYVIGVAVLLVWIAFWWPGRAHASPARLAAVFVTAGLLFLIHLSTPLMMLVVVWTDWLFAGKGERKGRFPTVLAATAGVACIALLSYAMVPKVPPMAVAHPFSVVWEKTWFGKVRNILTPFFVFSFKQMTVTLAVYVAAIALFWRTNRKANHWNTLAWCAGAFLVLYIVFPSNTPGTGYLDSRWLLPMYLLPFASAWHGGQRPATRVGLILVACAWINAAVLWRQTKQVDRELDDYAMVLNGLPPGRRLLPLVADNLRHGLRIKPYAHFAFWYEINRDGRVPSLFNFNGDGGGAPRQSFMSHITEINQLYTLPAEWGTTDFTPLDWTAIDRDYDYIVVAGRDPRVLGMIEPHARQLTRVGDITVYQPTEEPLLGSPVPEAGGGGTAPHAR